MRYREDFNYKTGYYGLNKRYPKPKQVSTRICKDCSNVAAKGKLRCLTCYDKWILTKTWG